MGWQAHADDAGRIYYVNLITQDSVWEKPTKPAFVSTFAGSAPSRVSVPPPHPPTHTHKHVMGAPANIAVAGLDVPSAHPHPTHPTPRSWLDPVAAAFPDRDRWHREWPEKG